MRRTISIITGIAIILAGMVFGGFGLQKYLEEENAGEEYEELKEQVIIELPETVVPDDEQGITIPIDFETLQVKCPDVYAWIEIPGTDINYPIVQRAGDDEYYLSHTAEGKKSMAGAIYTEEYNSKDFDDPNTVIYGHNMRNGSMFKQLHKYRNREFFSENQEVIIYQPNRILRYKIFAAYVYDSRHLLESFNFNDTQVYQEYLKDLLRGKGISGNLDKKTAVTAEDCIVTLSTCTGNDSQRYLVQAVLLSIEEKE